jgi:argininosuccinate lyase
LQEDKRPIMDAFEHVEVSLRALTGAIASATFHPERMRAALDRGHVCATDLADFLVFRGVPFREAHHVVGAVVRAAEERGIPIGELSPELLAAAHPALAGPELAAVLDPARAVERRSLVGGPAKARVHEAIADAKRRWSE